MELRDYEQLLTVENRSDLADEIKSDIRRADERLEKALARLPMVLRLLDVGLLGQIDTAQQYKNRLKYNCQYGIDQRQATPEDLPKLHAIFGECKLHENCATALHQGSKGTIRVFYDLGPDCPAEYQHVWYTVKEADPEGRCKITARVNTTYELSCDTPNDTPELPE